MSDVVQMWRCTSCGKWSHAQQRPKAHQRWISAGDKSAEYEPAEKVLSFDPGMSLDSHDDPGGWVVECGPFEEWHAERVS